MILQVQHITKYQYSHEVFIEPHHLYFHPSFRHYFKLLEFDINISPNLSGISFRTDAENNSYHQVWFNDVITELHIATYLKVETSTINPFNLLVEPNPKLDHKEALKIHLQTVDLSDELANWTKKKSDETGDNLITLLSYLTQSIKLDWIHEDRYVENLMTPVECFKSRRGSCRDLAWMLIQMLRNLGIAARFVSGYAFNPELTAGHELHAWVEAWVPGAGWIGLDPSTGLFATDQYIPVAASFKPEHTFPVQGTYRGAAEAQLSFEVKIQALES